MKEYGTIRSFIEIMNIYGVENVFFNPGIDNVPFLETIAEYRTKGLQCPRSILCLDEFVAMTAAHGNYMVTGKPQVVSVHSELGVLQLGGSLHNAQWGRVPVVFFTENQGPLQRKTWRGDSFDQNAMVRNFVKKDYEIRESDDISKILFEAFHVAATEPYGPVYINLPRNLLWSTEPVPDSVQPSIVKQEMPDPDQTDLQKAAEIILGSNNPLIVVGYSGRNPEAVDYLTILAETIGARVLTSDIRVNFPNTHPLTAIMPPTGGFGNSVLSDADVILSIDYDMHYAAPPSKLHDNVKIIHIDIDIFKKGVPLWNHAPDIAITADTRKAIPALTKIINNMKSASDSKIIDERIKTYKDEHAVLKAEWQKIAVSHSARKPISAYWLSYCINEIIDDNTLIVNQTISPAVIVAHLINRIKPGTLFSCAGGCIGWAPGAALGVKIGAPQNTVISLMGDGAFIYGCPEATLWAASFYHAPFLAVIFNNQGYGAIKGLFREMYNIDNMGADIANPPDYAGIAKSCHAFGRTIKEPEDVIPALNECLKEVKAGSPAVLDVWTDPV
jgi:acetolactate synthase-1/2/3 large subunit